MNAHKGLFPPVQSLRLFRDGVRRHALCAAALLAAAAARGAATYDGMTTPGILSVAVDAEGATLDAACVTSGITNIVKTGVGDLVAVPLETYAGDFSINEGRFLVANRYDMGADNVGTVFVNDGASLIEASTVEDWAFSLSVGKTFVFSGAPAATSPGVKLARDNTTGYVWLGSDATFRFCSDARVDINKQRLKLRGVIDLGGHVLTFDGARAWCQVQVDCLVTNGGEIVVQGRDTPYSPSATTFQNEGATFGFCASETPCALTLSNANYIARKNLSTAPATLNLRDAYVSANFVSANFGQKLDLDSIRWNGPVNAMGASAVANYAERANAFTLAGPIHGSGTLTIGPGWLNLLAADGSTFSGEVVVTGSADGRIAPEESGLALRDHSPLFPEAASVTFRQGARLFLADGVFPSLPGLTFEGDVDSEIAGGSVSVVPGGARPALAGLVKRGASTLTLASALRVTGETRVEGGTLKLPPRVFGHAGLMEWRCVDMSLGDQVGETIWGTQVDFTAKDAAGNLIITTNAADAVYVRAGAVRVFEGFKTVVSNGIRRATGYIYQGYLWNRSPAPATWQLAMHQRYRGTLRVNGQWATYNAYSESGTNVFTTTLQPGPNPILIYTLAPHWMEGQMSSARFDGLGLSYDPQPVAGETNVAHFARLDDGGSGRLLTIDTEEASADIAADLLPLLGRAVFADGTALDLGGNAYALGDLTGCPDVRDGSLTLTGAWTASSSALTAGRALAVEGALAFGAACVLEVDDVAALPRTREGLVLATATNGLAGRPKLGAALASAGWMLAASADGKALVLRPTLGLSLIIR